MFQARGRQKVSGRMREASNHASNFIASSRVAQSPARSKRRWASPFDHPAKRLQQFDSTCVAWVFASCDSIPSYNPAPRSGCQDSGRLGTWSTYVRWRKNRCRPGYGARSIRRPGLPEYLFDFCACLFVFLRIVAFGLCKMCRA